MLLGVNLPAIIGWGTRLKKNCIGVSVRNAQKQSPSLRVIYSHFYRFWVLLLPKICLQPANSPPLNLQNLTVLTPSFQSTLPLKVKFTTLQKVETCTHLPKATLVLLERMPRGRWECHLLILKIALLIIQH